MAAFWLGLIVWHFKHFKLMLVWRRIWCVCSVHLFAVQQQLIKATVWRGKINMAFVNAVNGVQLPADPHRPARGRPSSDSLHL